VKILDRERYWAFFKAYFICFVALVGLCVVIDAFTNFDEFSEVASGMKLLRNIGRYYLVRMSFFYDKLCGILAMMAAIFAVTWMQKSNELLAMLAAGISTKRAIRPVLIAAVAVNLLAIANQECIVPDIAEELMKPPDDDGERAVIFFHSREDLRGIVINGGKDGDRRTKTINKFTATLPVSLIGVLGGLEAKQARYIPPTHPRAPIKGGWLLRGATLTPPDAMENVVVPVEQRWLVELKEDQLEGFPPPNGKMKDLGGQTYFLRTNIDFASVSRSRQWFRFASTMDLIRGLDDPANRPERLDIGIFLHGRILRPVLAMALMFLSLPLVLGGDGRNMFINLGLSLGTSAAFYGVSYLTTYLGGNGVISAELSAWAPLIGFGTLAVARWDTIRT
jgi:lipopolysaccharide export system permease protein